MKLHRGFKTEAKKIALEVRGELKVQTFAPLDPYALATLYGIEVYDLSMPDLPSKAVEHFTSGRVNVFSAALIPVDTGSV